MNERMETYRQGRVAQRNPMYRRLENFQAKASREGNTREALRLLKLKQTIPSRLHADPNFRRLYYIRYADD